MWKGATFSQNNFVCWDRALQVLQSEDRVQKSDTLWVIWPINNQSLCRGGIWIWLAALVFLCSGSAGAAGVDGAAREQKYRSFLDFAIWRTQKKAPLRGTFVKMMWCDEEVSEALRQTSLHWDTDYNIISKENQNDWKKKNMFWFGMNFLFKRPFSVF